MDIEESIYNKVLRFVSIRPRSEKEVRDYIYRKASKKIKSSSDLASLQNKILENLVELKLINDEDFAKTWVGWRLSSSNPKGMRVIRGELFAKGVDRDLVSELLDGEEYKNMEIDAAKRVCSKKAKVYKDPLGLKNYLLSRGFSYCAINSAF